MLRNFSSDSPLEGRSSFAVEMTEMKYVLEDVTNKSLVLVDELGKGTESKAGAALAGAMLEALDRSGCIGAFATHLHDLLAINLNLTNRTRRMKMEIEDVFDPNLNQTVRRPTWRILPGESKESLALDVARQCRLPEETLTRAAALYKAIQEINQEPKITHELELTSESTLVESAVPVRSFDDTSDQMFDTIPSEALRIAARLLHSTAAHFLSSMASSHEHITVDLDDLAVKYVPSGCLPGAHTVGQSSVYVSYRPGDGRFYIGMTLDYKDNVDSYLPFLV
jgi:DNA mismatch repair ATPase MutS